MVLIVSIVLYYTYTMINQQYLRRRVIAIPKRFGDTLSSSRFDFENLTQSEARELPTSGCDTKV